MTVLDIIKEPLKTNYPKMPKDEMDARAKDMAVKVGLNPTYLKRYPIMLYTNLPNCSKLSGLLRAVFENMNKKRYPHRQLF